MQALHLSRARHPQQSFTPSVCTAASCPRSVASVASSTYRQIYHEPIDLCCTSLSSPARKLSLCCSKFTHSLFLKAVSIHRSNPNLCSPRRPLLQLSSCPLLQIEHVDKLQHGDPSVDIFIFLVQKQQHGMVRKKGSGGHDC
ncbi:hypothetical protein KP509_1Z129500 [Ceratopteris richardii]|nr:hypothetical protein KP509_1Z129500 [Ceratopteris richardii]